MARERRALAIGRTVMSVILAIGIPVVAADWRFFTRPIPQDGYGIWGQLLGSPPTSFFAKVAVLSVLLAIPVSILGLMFQWRLLSKFWTPEAEPATYHAMDAVAAIDSDVAARLGRVEDAVDRLMEMETRNDGGETRRD